MDGTALNQALGLSERRALVTVVWAHPQNQLCQLRGGGIKSSPVTWIRLGWKAQSPAGSQGWAAHSPVAGNHLRTCDPAVLVQDLHFLLAPWGHPRLTVFRSRFKEQGPKRQLRSMMWTWASVFLFTWPLWLQILSLGTWHFCFELWEDTWVLDSPVMSWVSLGLVKDRIS